MLQVGLPPKTRSLKTLHPCSKRSSSPQSLRKRERESTVNNSVCKLFVCLASELGAVAMRSKVCLRLNLIEQESSLWTRGRLAGLVHVGGVPKGNFGGRCWCLGEGCGMLGRR